MFNKTKDNVIVVETKKELEAAIKRNEKCIEVRGEMFDKLKWLRRLSPAKIVALAFLMATTVIPNPTSGASFVATAGIVGKEVATIIFSGAVSFALVFGIIKGYSIEIGAGDKSLRLISKDN